MQKNYFENSTLVLRKANPGWTADFAPSVLISWLKNLGLITVRDKALELTDSGAQWVEQIHWTPKELPISNNLDPVITQADSAQFAAVEIERPSLKDVIAGFNPDFPFPDDLIGQLDAGLWSHPRRHFAVLTGLSGTGKTQRARGHEV